MPRLLDRLAALAKPPRCRRAQWGLTHHPEVGAFVEPLRLGIGWRFEANDPAGFPRRQRLPAEVNDVDAVGRRIGRWASRGVSEDVGASDAAASRNFFISAPSVTDPSRGDSRPR